MEKFERDIKTLFEYSRYEQVPEMQKVINDFEKEYPSAVTRARVSLDELDGAKSGETGRKAPDKAERQKGRGKAL